MEEKRSTIIYASLVSYALDFSIISFTIMLWHDMEFNNFHQDKFIILSVPYIVLALVFPILIYLLRTKYVKIQLNISF